LIGVVPVMLGAIIVSTDDRYAGAAMWLMSISPLLAPICGCGASMPMAELPFQVSLALVPAFWFWQGVASLLVVAFLAKLWRARRGIRDATAVLK
jgi:hypothetical protein